MNRFWAVGILVIGLGSPDAIGASKCDILTAQDVTTGNSELERRQAANHLICSSEFRDTGDQKSLALKASYGTFKGNGNYTESSFNAYKKDNCNQGSSSEYERSLAYSITKILPEGRAKLALECLKAEWRVESPLVCYAEPVSTKIAVKLNFAPFGEDRLRINALTAGNAQASPSLPTEFPDEMSPGDRGFIFDRRVDQDFAFLVNAKTVNTNREVTCAVVIPRDMPVPTLFDKVKSGRPLVLNLDSSLCGPPTKIGSLKCGWDYDAYYYAAANRWRLVGPNTSEVVTDRWYDNALQQDGKMTAWGLLLDFDNSGVVRIDGNTVGTLRSN